MRKLEGKGLKYSSPEFAKELTELSDDIKDSIGVDLARRTGERNLIRNSGQYWRAVGLIPAGDHSGEIRLTDFGRRVADHDISQTEFSTITIQTFKLPNAQIQSREECLRWESNGIVLYPLRIIMGIILRLNDFNEGYLTTDELTKIVIPLSAYRATIEDYVNFIRWYRAEEIVISDWPNCCPAANDFRIAREYLLFLSNYGYIERREGRTREDEQYRFNPALANEIREMLATPISDVSLQQVLEQIRSTDLISEVEKADASLPSKPSESSAF